MSSHLRREVGPNHPGAEVDAAASGQTEQEQPLRAASVPGGLLWLAVG